MAGVEAIWNEGLPATMVGSGADAIQMTMPFLLYNMGGEMLYILQQRLYSQKIRKDKIESVLNDLVTCLYSPSLLQEMLQRGPLPSNTYMTKVFHSIASTSIMTLSDSGMEKLYELMVMALKFQTLSVTHPKDIIAVTMNHLEQSRLLVRPGSAALQAADNALLWMVRYMKQVTGPQYHHVRAMVLKFCQGRKTRVSLFLREKLQYDNGMFPLSQGGGMPNDELVQMPGVIHYRDSGDSGASQPASMDAFKHPLVLAIGAQRKNDNFNFRTRDVTHGCNMYISQSDDQRLAALEASELPKLMAVFNGPPPLNPAAPPGPSSEEDATAAVAERRTHYTDADFLSMVLNRPSEAADSGGFKFNPFAQADMMEGNSPKRAVQLEGLQDDDGGEVIEIQPISRERFHAINSELAGMMEELEVLDTVYQGNASSSSLLELLREQGLA
eukprot:TRINITY_DN4412_c0_g1_i4.p1 TRINITY_DN4412_c0_g1~~TRINITY_DN4412_c0_g1_i4.p1  ORF type:complete len:442 (+),score=181.99 TRINITY_DN4412_c0_g1_i4:129-1454(+)